MIAGLTYIDNFITESDQKELIKSIDEMPWDNSLKRRTQHYGYKYDYTKKKIDSSLFLGEIPSFLQLYCKILRNRNFFEETPDQVIINEYYPGQGIGAHTDCVPCFGKTIASISLNSSCVIELNRWKYEPAHYLLKPLSLLALYSDARYMWTHSIPARLEDKWNGEIIPRGRRISLTFRKIIL